MYVPKHFEVTDVGIMHGLMREYSLATLVTFSSGGLNANHIPMHTVGSPEPYGILQGHVARSNSILDDIDKKSEALAIFQGPNSYITPSWYASKKAHGKVVPTWNYIVVHAYGKLRTIDDEAWLLEQLNKLTDHNEAEFSEQWKVADAPVMFTQKLLGSIIGIEMEITRLIGKWKISQNQPEQNKQSIVEGLNSVNKSLNSTMAEYVKAEMKTI